MRKINSLLALSILCLSCNSSTKKEQSSSIENEKLVQTYFAHFNKHDWKKMAAMYATIAEFKDPSLGTGIVKQTQKQISDKYAELNAIFPDLKDSITAIYPSGDNHIVVEFISTGTAPDKTKFELPICTIFTIENGKITKDFTYYDNFEQE